MSGVVKNIKMCSEQMGIVPDSWDKQGPVFKKDTIYSHYLARIKVGTFFKSVEFEMTNEVEKAISAVDKVSDRFSKSIDVLMERSDGVAASAKNSSAKIRDAAEKLSVGLQRVEKAANFDRLERYVDLLERAATAMTLLAELEKNGKLEKIASAIR